MIRKYLMTEISIIVVVVLLVLGSLTNVIGYQSVKPTLVNDSPLFSTRTQRAINQQQNIINSRYLGMGKGNLLQIPPVENKTELLKIIFESIKKLDDDAFQMFLLLVRQRLMESTSLHENQVHEILDGFLQLRTYADLPVLISPQMYTFGTSCLSSGCGCEILFFIVLLVLIVMSPLIIVGYILQIIFNIIYKFFHWLLPLSGGTLS